MRSGKTLRAPHATPVVLVSAIGGLIALAGGSAWAADDEALLADVRAAWESRRERIRSFHYECEGQRRVVGAKNRGLDPDSFLARDIPTEDMTFEKRFTFSFSVEGNKVADRLDAEAWYSDSNRVERTQTSEVFDGQWNRTLNVGRHFPFAAARRTDKADDAVMVGLRHTPVWLWFDPTGILERIAYFPEKMSVTARSAFRDGRECVELLIPSTSGRWTIRLYVDPARDYVPAGFVQQKLTVVARELSIAYAPDPEAGWRVAAWKDSWFDPQSGGPKFTASYTVTRCTVNRPLDEELFTVEFPPGSQVSEGDAETVRYYIVREDGTQRPITAEQYGSHYLKTEPPSRPIRMIVVAIAGACVAILAALAAFLRGRQRR